MFAKTREMLLVEPIAKTQYPPLGLLKISSWLKDTVKGCRVFSQVGEGVPQGLHYPEKIFITSLFTWDHKYLVKCVDYYNNRFPNSEILLGGIGISLVDGQSLLSKNVSINKGLLLDAEYYPPDYSQNFQRKIDSSITFTTRGCNRGCSFCNVNTLEPTFFVKPDWHKDINPEYRFITLWDNNFLQSPNFGNDCERLAQFNKSVDFNQGLDARLFGTSQAKALSKIKLNPIRFAFDHVDDEPYVRKAIQLAKKYIDSEIRVYVLFNFEDDTPEDLYYRLNILNEEGVLSFPMRYRSATTSNATIASKNWDTYLLRALNLSLLFYYRNGLIRKNRDAFLKIYGHNAKEFEKKLYAIYDYDRTLRKKK